jgi:hypothetical protein
MIVLALAFGFSKSDLLRLNYLTDIGHSVTAVSEGGNKPVDATCKYKHISGDFKKSFHRILEKCDPYTDTILLDYFWLQDTEWVKRRYGIDWSARVALAFKTLPHLKAFWLPITKELSASECLSSVPTGTTVRSIKRQDAYESFFLLKHDTEIEQLIRTMTDKVSPSYQLETYGRASPAFLVVQRKDTP